ncbi:MAG: membrane protein insertion efficiency factor YidD [Nitrospirota bacterium]|jgi:putative membrane protein insertion efficiency factor
MVSTPGRLLVLAIDAYRNSLSFLWPGTCRFAPSCSEYAREAVLKYGALKGSALAVRRLLKCHPFHPGGYDPLV